MPRGRKPKPATVHELHGTHRRDRHGEAGKIGANSANSAVKALKTAPRDLTKDEKTHWRYFIKLLSEIGTDVAFVPDEQALRLLVSLRVDYTHACEELEENGHYYWSETKAGGMLRKANPAIAAKRQAETRIYAMLSEFGLTPSGRARLGNDLSKPNQNPKDRFFS